MAFRSNGPITLSLPAFRGETRRIILVCVASFFTVWILASFAPRLFAVLLAHLALCPAFVLRGEVWQLLTYAVFPLGLVSEFFALLSVWFFASALEDQLGSRWLREFFFASVIGGGLFATLLIGASRGRAFGIVPGQFTWGLYPFVMALLLAFARFNADVDVTLFFALRIKAKYLAALYLLYYLGATIIGGDRFGALTAVCASFAGWLYLRFVPRQGLGFFASERWYSMRNAFYRSKRRRAAKKFEVYMRKQGRDVHFDSKGKFVEDDERPSRDPKDRRWIN